MVEKIIIAGNFNEIDVQIKQIIEDNEYNLKNYKNLLEKNKAITKTVDELQEKNKELEEVNRTKENFKPEKKKRNTKK